MSRSSNTLITLDGKSGFHAMGLIKVTTPPLNADQLISVKKKKLQRKKFKYRTSAAIMYRNLKYLYWKVT